MKTKLLAAFALSALALSSCTSSMGTSFVPSGNAPQVRLEQNNYRVLANQVSAESKGFVLLPILPTSFNAIKGFFSGGGAENADIANSSSGFTFKTASELDATTQVYKNCGEGNTTNRAAALINLRKEYTNKNYILFSRPAVKVTGDLIEFTR